MRKRKIMFLFFVFSLVFPLSIMAQDQIKVSFVVGPSVQYKTKAGNWQKLTKKVQLKQDDIVKTGRSSVTRLKMGPLSLKVGPNTTVILRNLSINMQFYLQNGKLWTSLAKRRGKQSLHIQSPQSVVGVRGTEFIYSSIEGIDKLFVIKGAVAFGKDMENLIKTITAGNMGIFKDGEFKVKKFTDQDKNEIQKGFAHALSLDKFKKYYLSRRNYLRRSYFKRQIRREIFSNNRFRRYVRNKISDDRTAGRVVTDRDGNVTQILQLMRKTANNIVTLYNITSKKNFVNVVYYTGTFENTVPNSLTKLKAMTDNREIRRDMYIVQREGSASGDYIRFLENKVDESAKTQDITVNGTSFSSNFPSLKQTDNNPYLEADFGNDLKLRVYVLDNNGDVISSPDVKATLDFLTNGSVEFSFIDDTPGAGAWNFTSTNVRFNTLPDIGFIVWLKD